MDVIEADFPFEEVLALPLFAHLATASEDGPRESPTWFLYEDDVLWLIGKTSDSFIKRIERDPRVAVGIVDFDHEQGKLRHVGIRGHAAVIPIEHSRLHRFLGRYLGEPPWNSSFKSTVIDKLDRMVMVQPETIVARDQSYFK
ncbi:MAG TPA: pyridoxamine 5'-phosphate oxidase family protein [Candidatus Aquilonibacter sp.]|nr:pyridoxamine 5'-phosphate oxidase family protein [Candidatus Aquilonibacter sp.]